MTQSSGIPLFIWSGKIIIVPAAAITVIREAESLTRGSRQERPVNIKVSASPAWAEPDGYTTTTIPTES